MLSTFYTACVLMTAPITVLASSENVGQQLQGQQLQGQQLQQQGLQDIQQIEQQIMNDGIQKVATLDATAILEYTAFETCVKTYINANKSQTTPCNPDTLNALGTALGKCSAKAPAASEVVSDAVKATCAAIKTRCASWDCVAWIKLAGNAGSLTVLATVALLVFTL